MSISILVLKIGIYVTLHKKLSIDVILRILKNLEMGLQLSGLRLPSRSWVRMSRSAWEAHTRTPEPLQLHARACAPDPGSASAPQASAREILVLWPLHECPSIRHWCRHIWMCPWASPGAKKETPQPRIFSWQKTRSGWPQQPFPLTSPGVLATPADTCSLGHWGCLQTSPMLSSADGTAWRTPLPTPQVTLDTASTHTHQQQEAFPSSSLVGRMFSGKN